MGKSAKGSGFEREICVQLSEWWTSGDRSDIFWRTAGSGARATTRAKQGKATSGQYGDITAIDPVGMPLIDLITLELKRGYTKASFHDALDRDRHVVQEWEGFVDKAYTSHQAAGSYAWGLIARRDRRTAWFWCPRHLLAALRNVGAFARKPRPWLECTLQIRHTTGAQWHSIAGMPFELFLEAVKPVHIKNLTRELANA